MFPLTAHPEPDDHAAKAEEFERRGQRAQDPANEHAGHGQHESGLSPALIRVDCPGNCANQYAFKFRKMKREGGTEVWKGWRESKWGTGLPEVT